MKYSVLINNTLQVRNSRPVFAGRKNGEWAYFETLSRGNEKEITESFNSGLRKMFSDAASHYLKPFTARRNFHEYFSYEVNEVLGVLHLRSEIYEAQVRLFEEYNEDDRSFEMLDADRGERVDLKPFFLEDQERFLTQAIEAYSVLIAHIEVNRNAMVLNNTYNMGIAFLVDGVRWMNIIDLRMSSINNPFSWLIKRPSIGYSKIVKFLNSGEINRDFREPQIFVMSEKHGNMSYHVATTKDILALLNINLSKPVSISSAFTVQLLGSCLLRGLGFELKTEFLPTTAPRYYTVDDEGSVAKSAWDRNELEGQIYELNILSSYLDKELGRQLAGEFLPEFEGMRLI